MDKYHRNYYGADDGRHEIAMIVARQLIKDGKFKLTVNASIYYQMNEEEQDAVDVFMDRVEQEVQRFVEAHPDRFPAGVEPLNNAEQSTSDS